MANNEGSNGSASGLNTQLVPLDQLYDHPDNDYPSNEGELRSLMESIRSDGMAQLPLVRRYGDGFQIIAGHRRVECYRRLAKEDPERWGMVPVSVMEECSDERAAILLDATNLMTRQLTPLERATRFERLWKAVPALRAKTPELKGVRTSQVISDIVTRETGQSISRASIDRALAAGRRAKQVSELVDQKADELNEEWQQEIRQREGFTPEVVDQIASRDEREQRTIWADYQREDMTPKQLARSLERKAPKTDVDVEHSLDQVIAILRDVQAWRKRYSVDIDMYRIEYIRGQLDRIAPL